MKKLFGLLLAVVILGGSLSPAFAGSRISGLEQRVSDLEKATYGRIGDDSDWNKKCQCTCIEINDIGRKSYYSVRGSGCFTDAACLKITTDENGNVSKTGECVSLCSPDAVSGGVCQ